MSERTPHRIVSFLASGTEILVALGLEDRIVGISHECDYPQHVLDRPRLSRPRFDPAGLDSGQVDAAVRAAMQEFGSVYEVDAVLLADLEPDMILTQAVCEVCAVPTPGVRALAGEMGIGANIVSLDAHTVEEILASIIQVANAAGVPERGESVVAELRARIDAVRSAVADVAPRSALAIEWLDPPFTPGHWVPEMIEAAGGKCLVGSAGGHSEQVGWDVMSGLDPDVLLVMPCGYDVEKSRADADMHAERLAAAAPRALAEDNAFVVNGSAYFNRSGPRFVRGIEILAGLLHPDRWPQPEPDDAVHWQPRPLQEANP
ncbi:MAG TPA: ABC transporter substrate-binding protein [Longimicrobiales bacterium]